MTDKEYYELIQPYEDAMKLLLTRLEVLNHSIYKTKTGKPVHNIQYRIKKKDSIEEKLVRHGFEPTLEDVYKRQHVSCLMKNPASPSWWRFPLELPSSAQIFQQTSSR